MWHMIALGVLAWHWYDAAHVAETALRERDESERPKPRDTIDSGRVVMDADGQYRID